MKIAKAKGPFVDSYGRVWDKHPSRFQTVTNNPVVSVLKTIGRILLIPILFIAGFLTGFFLMRLLYRSLRMDYHYSNEHLNRLVDRM